MSIFRVWAIGVIGVAALWATHATVLRAYVLKDSRWADGSVVMQLQLGSSGGGLIDGNADWGASFEGAMAEWNQHLSRVRYTVVRNSSAAIAERNGLNNVFFSDTVYADAFGEETLATTLTWTRSGARTESDIVFNTAKSWNSYRGPLRSGVRDIRRVALHELGHVLGLDHPDEASQSVQAIMNSRASDIDALLGDDIDGARALYPSGSAPAPAPPPPPSLPSPSSSYPASAHPYADNADSTWTYTLTGNPGAINVTFDPRTEVEQGYDYIHVMDGGGNSIAGSPFTGSSLAGQTKRVPGAVVRIRLSSDSSVTAWGFAVTAVTAATSPSPSSSYPTSAHPYSDNSDTAWSFTLPGSPQAINVAFDPQTAVEQGYDYIYVMDGNGNNIDGSPFTGTRLAGQTKLVPGATVRIRLTSDGSITGWGFTVTNVSSATSPPPPSYPTSPHPYSDKVDNTWSYALPGGPPAISVSFDARTEVEVGYDYLYVMDGNNNNIAGSPFTGRSLAGQTRRVPGATVRIRLTSDDTVTGWGFAVTSVTAASLVAPLTELGMPSKERSRRSEQATKPAVAVKPTLGAVDRNHIGSNPDMAR